MDVGLQNIFYITRGIKQGCPASGLQFILVIELLLIKIRSTKAIKGIDVKDREIKLTAFADDINNSEQFYANQYDINDTDWEFIYKLPFCVTIESKMRPFQFKINHNIYFTNEKLFKMKMKSDQNCTFCKSEIEMLSHLFSQCKYVKPLWDFLNDKFSHNFSEKERIFGCYENIGQRSYDVKSHASILLKHYIHICRLSDNIPNLSILMKRIKYNETLEREIAKNSRKSRNHFRKWQHFLENVDL